MKPLLMSVLMATLISPVAFAQPPETAEEERAGEPGGDPSQALPSGAAETIDRILQEDRESLEDEAALGYDDGGRRDPFRSLLSQKNQPEIRGPRPPGIPGLLIDDLTVKGIFMTPQGGVAQVQSSARTSSYLLREGAQLYDGEVLAIRFQKDSVAEVVFKQGISDPSAIKPFREVVKKVAP